MAVIIIIMNANKLLYVVHLDDCLNQQNGIKIAKMGCLINYEARPWPKTWPKQTELFETMLSTSISLKANVYHVSIYLSTILYYTWTATLQGFAGFERLVGRVFPWDDPSPVRLFCDPLLFMWSTFFFFILFSWHLFSGQLVHILSCTRYPLFKQLDWIAPHS